MAKIQVHAKKDVGWNIRWKSDWKWVGYYPLSDRYFKPWIESFSNLQFWYDTIHATKMDRLQKKRNTLDVIFEGSPLRSLKKSLSPRPKRNTLGAIFSNEHAQESCTVPKRNTLGAIFSNNHAQESRTARSKRFGL